MYNNYKFLLLVIINLNSVFGQIPNWIACDSYRQCADTEITAVAGACRAFYACQNSIIDIDNFIYCTGESSCRSATLTIEDNIYAWGPYTLQEAHIAAERVYGYGYRSLYLSRLDSTNELAMNVYAYGFQSGWGSDFICRAGSICNLYCKGDGCFNMDFICLSGSTCNVYPASCSSGGIVNGINCPIRKTSLTSKDDPGLLQYIKDRKNELDNNKDPEYIKFIRYQQDFDRINKSPSDNVTWIISKSSFYSALIAIIILLSVSLICCAYYVKNERNNTHKGGVDNY